MKTVIKILIILMLIISLNNCSLFKVNEIKQNKVYKIFKNKYIL